MDVTFMLGNKLNTALPYVYAFTTHKRKDTLTSGSRYRAVTLVGVQALPSVEAARQSKEQ